MASQCVPPSLWGSALTIGVQGFRIGRDDGNNSEGRHRGKKLRHAEYKESERYPFCVLKIGRDIAPEIYEDCTLVFEVQQASDCLGQWPTKLQFDRDINILRD